MVDVMNLCTAQVITYDTDNPIHAVKLAYIQYTQGNLNTWQYSAILPTINTYDGGGLTVCCGEWAAFKDGRRVS